MKSPLTAQLSTAKGAAARSAVHGLKRLGLREAAGMGNAGDINRVTDRKQFRFYTIMATK